MIITRLMGGLGNQMFQYAIGLVLSKNINTEFVVDDSILIDRKNLNSNSVLRELDLDVFKLDYDSNFKGKVTYHNSWFLRNINKFIPYEFKSYLVEKHFHYDKKIKQLRNENIILEGYWQSFKYFDLYKSEILKSFTFKDEFIDKSDSLLYAIESTNSVCLNVRRGDFLTDSLLGFKDVNYFINASQLLQSKVGLKLHYFIFSDDISWCAENLTFLSNYTIVDHSHKGYKFSNYLFLMSKCKYFIIPNSTFAWWAAWLSSNLNKIVIAPVNWFNDTEIDTSDLIPSTWYRV